MALKKLDLQPNLPDFNLPEPYSSDVWDFDVLDFYLLAPEKSKKEWRKKEREKDNKIYFTDCNNEYIREELKYFVYMTITSGSVSLFSFVAYYNQVKCIIRFCNNQMQNYFSILDCTNIHELYEDYIVNTEKKQSSKKIYMGYNTAHKKNLTTQTSPYINRLIAFIECIKDYYDDRPEVEKDIWQIDKLPYQVNNNPSNPIRSLNFSGIIQESFKKWAKEYAKFYIDKNSLVIIKAFIINFSLFSEWININYPEIKLLSELTREIMEDYIIYIKTETEGKNKTKSNKLGALSNFFEHLRLLENKDVPHHFLIDSDDYRTKVHIEPNPYSDSEIKRINKLISQIDNIQIARFIFVLEVIGCRPNELCALKPDAIRKTEHGYSLHLELRKNKNTNLIPIENIVGQILEQALAESKKQFGEDVEYVFAISKDKCMRSATIYHYLSTKAAEFNLVDDSGQPMVIQLKRFRTTVASKYLQMGMDANIITLMLGHRVKDTMKHYTAIENHELKRMLQPRLDKADNLIKNRGNLNPKELQVMNAATRLALPNGFCTRPAETGICDDCNSCYECRMFMPDPRFTVGYRMQLIETNKSIEALENQENHNERLLQYNYQLKKKLEEIIERMDNIEE